MKEYRWNWKDHTFINGLKKEHIEQLAACSMPVEFEAGTVIFKTGDPANRFYLIGEGSVVLRSPKGSEVQRIGAGEVLGWSWLFEPYEWQFDAVALEHTSAVFFYGTRLREFCETHSDFGYELMKRCSGIAIRRLEHTLRKLAEE